jgi:glycosyltransferase involved in cell wall biosynthesis
MSAVHKASVEEHNHRGTPVLSGVSADFAAPMALPSLRAAEPGDGRLRVLFVIGCLHGGGTERVLLRLLSGLDRGRFRPSLALFEARGALLSQVPADVPVLDCGRRGSGGQVRWFFRLARLLETERPHVVVSFLWFANAVTVLARGLARSTARVVVSERSTVEGSREGAVVEGLRRAAITALYPRADRVTANSQSLRRQLERRLGRRASRVVWMPNPVDLGTPVPGEPQEGRGEHGPPVVLGLGRLSPEKGYDLLIRALEQVPHPARLVLVGEGRQEGELRRLAGELGLAERVEFTGFLHDPGPLLRRASVFVLPSRYEGFPNALLEAMAAGLPCVATRCPTGPEEIITDGADGLLVPTEDPSALAAAIRRLLGDGALRARLGRAAAGRVAPFAVPAAVARFEALLEEVCA